jgi:hypothetical protein
MARLVVFHALIDPIQAIALGGGSVMRAGGNVDSRVAARLRGDGADGGGVVGVDADEEVVITVLDGHQIVLEHAADDGVLAPQRDKDGDGTLATSTDSRVRGPGEAEAAGRKPDQGDKQVIQTADHYPHRDRDQECGNPVIQALE